MTKDEIFLYILHMKKIAEFAETKAEKRTQKITSVATKPGKYWLGLISSGVKVANLFGIVVWEFIYQILFDSF